MQLSQPGLHELLPLERRLVLGVLAQIAQLDRLGNRLRKEDIELMAELVDFPAQLFAHFTNHGSAVTEIEDWPGCDVPGLEE